MHVCLSVSISYICLQHIFIIPFIADFASASSLTCTLPPLANITNTPTTSTQPVVKFESLRSHFSDVYCDPTVDLPVKCIQLSRIVADMTNLTRLHVTKRQRRELTESESDLSWLRETMEKHSAPPTQIRPNLILGADKDARDLETLRSLGVTHIVNAAADCDCHYEDAFQYLHVKLFDSPQENIAKHLARVLEFLKEVNGSGGVVLVHCQQGISRSCSLVLAWLMAHEGLSMDEALADVRTKRSFVKPNEGFAKQLREFERSLNTMG